MGKGLPKLKLESDRDLRFQGALRLACHPVLVIEVTVLIIIEPRHYFKHPLIQVGVVGIGAGEGVIVAFRQRFAHKV